MLMAPRLIEALVRELEREPLLTDGSTVPGGVWRDVIPQDIDLRRGPAIVLAFVLGLPNATQPQMLDLTIEARGEIAGTSVQPLREAMDRVDVILRRAATLPGQDFDGLKYGNAHKTQEIERTTLEANSQLLFAHLGGQYTYTCSEPPLDSQ